MKDKELSENIIEALKPTRKIKKGILESIADFSPLWFSYGLGVLCRKYIAPFKDGFFDYLRYKKFYKFLEQSQWWKRERLEQYQNEMFRNLIAYVYDNVPYYRDLLDIRKLKPADFKTVKDLEKLPILTKELLHKNFNRLISKKFSQRFLNKNSCLGYTSGSTGTPSFFLKDRKMFFRILASVAWRSHMGHCRIDSKHIKFWSRCFVERNIHDTCIHDPWARRISLSTIPQKKDYLKGYLQVIKKFNPEYVAGPPSFLYKLACYAHENHYVDVQFPVFFSIYENLYSFQKKIIESQFCCETFNLYSSEEFSIIAAECDRHEGMHIDIRKGVMEIVDEQGCVIGNGKQGRIVYTGFNNLVMPLIRYDLGDIGSFSTQHCSCERGLPILKSLDGRTSEVLIYRDKYIYPSLLSVILEEFINIKECQFVQKEAEKITINIVKRKAYTSEDTNRLLAKLRQLLGGDLGIEICFVNAIPRNGIGKFQLVRKQLAK